MEASLDSRFRTVSPRLNPKPFPFISLALHGGSIALFCLLLWQAWGQSGVLAWSVGLAYVAYDTALILFVAAKTLPLMQIQTPANEDKRAGSRVAVLIAARNEHAVLAATVEALAGQDLPPDMILLVDDGSTDRTPQVLEQAFGLAVPRPSEMSISPGLPALHWLRLPHGGKARALNAALERTDCDVVLTVDADTHLEPGAIAAMRRAFEDDPHLVAATGILAPVCDDSLKGRIFEGFQTYEYVRNFISRAAWMHVDGLLLISGAFAAFRREAVVAVGGFDPECLVEDYELIHRLHRHSADAGLAWRVRAIGDARARTDAPAGPVAFLRQRRRWFGGFLQTQFWNRDMVGNPRYGRLGTLMLPVKALDTVQPIYGLAAFLLLIGFLATGRFILVLPILSVMLVKAAIDLAFHYWFIGLYHRWTGAGSPFGGLRVLLYSLAEPFSFQLLRHMAALLGWGAFLSGTATWGSQSRKGLISERASLALEEGQA